MPRGISGNAEKGFQVILADSWPLYGVTGLQLSPFSAVVAQSTHTPFSVII